MVEAEEGVKEGCEGESLEVGHCAGTGTADPSAL